MVASPLGILGSARLLGHYRHAELVGHERLGARVLEVARAPVRLYLLRCAASHAWRAGEIEVLLPVSVTLPSAAELTVAIDGRIEAAFSLLDGAGDDELVVSLRHVIYPALRASYAMHLASCSPFADPPVALVLRRLIAEVDAVIAEGEGLVIEGDYELSAHLEDVLSGGVRLDGDGGRLGS